MHRPTRLRDHLENLADLLVLLPPGMPCDRLDVLGLPNEPQTHMLDRGAPAPTTREGVLLAAPDLLTLRRVATGLPNIGYARSVGVWIERPAAVLPSVAPRPEWPALEHIAASLADEQFVLLTFSSPAPVRPVLLQIARSAGLSAAIHPAHPTLGARRDEPRLWPPMDPAATIAPPTRLFDARVDLPPDLILLARPQGSAEPLDPPPTSFVQEAHHVLGRPPAVRVEDADMTWETLASLTETEAETALSQRGPLSLGAIDEQLLNPHGFDNNVVGTAVPLVQRPEGHAAITREGLSVAIETRTGLSDADLPFLRGLPGLRLDWKGGRGPQAYCRLVAGLAMAGVPLTTDQTPGWARHFLAPGLVAALERPVDLTDRLRREEHSVMLRRASLQVHASGPWRQALARDHGLQETAQPTVSVLLVTRRPEMLGFALRQVARQRGAPLELIVATHGFDASPAVLDVFEEQSLMPIQTFRADSSLVFGHVLNSAASRASGDVLLKMDDDDWYGPDFVADLLLARTYSGADIVGCAPEFTFVEPLWVTTRRPDPSEVYRPFVAGGTMLMDRGVFRSLGGFRQTVKYVDATMLASVVESGGRVYRSHGLGYVLRRGGQGHTWDPGLGYFVSRQRAPEQWRGFCPSALLRPSEEDLPIRPGDEKVTP